MFKYNNVRRYLSLNCAVMDTQVTPFNLGPGAITAWTLIHTADHTEARHAQGE